MSNSKPKSDSAAPSPKKQPAKKTDNEAKTQTKAKTSSTESGGKKSSSAKQSTTSRKKTTNPKNPPKSKKEEEKSTIGSIIEPWVSDERFSGIFDRISDVTNSAYKLAKKTTGTSYKVGKAIIQSQDQLKLMVAAGESLKDLREVAGLTVNELSDAINLKDKTLIEAVENGTATLSFELILRLSAMLARNDPIPFILKYTRTYSPETWKLLDDWGAGRLPLQYEREREFINIYRSQDDARDLSDDGFNKVLEFTKHAFNMALHFVAEQELEGQRKAKLREKAEAESDTEAEQQAPLDPNLAESLKPENPDDKEDAPPKE